MSVLKENVDGREVIEKGKRWEQETSRSLILDFRKIFKMRFCENRSTSQSHQKFSNNSLFVFISNQPVKS